MSTDGYTSVEINGRLRPALTCKHVAEIPGAGQTRANRVVNAENFQRVALVQHIHRLCSGCAVGKSLFLEPLQDVGVCLYLLSMSP